MPLDASIYGSLTPPAVQVSSPFDVYAKLQALQTARANQLALEQDRQQKAQEIATQTALNQQTLEQHAHALDVVQHAKQIAALFGSDDEANGEIIKGLNADPEVQQQAYAYWKTHHEIGQSLKDLVAQDRVNAAKLIQASTPQGQPYDPASVLAAMHLDHSNTDLTEADPPEIRALYDHALQDPAAMRQIVDYWAAGGPGAKAEEFDTKPGEIRYRELPGQTPVQIATGGPEPPKGTPAEQLAAANEALRQAKAAGLPTADLEGKVATLQQSITQNAAAARSQDTASELEARAVDLDARRKRGEPLSKEDATWLQAYQDNKTLGTRTTFNLNEPNREDKANTARVDRSYTETSRQLNALRKPVEDQLNNIGTLTLSLNQMTPQADALIAPELLKTVVGGQGSGVRMTDTELNRIAGGRSEWENLKASLQKWAVDPSQALQLTDAQRTQMRNLVKAVQQKAQDKLQILNKAGQDLIDAGDVDTHRRILQGAREALTEAATSGGGAPLRKPIPNVPGGVAESTDGGKTWKRVQ